MDGGAALNTNGSPRSPAGARTRRAAAGGGADVNGGGDAYYAPATGGGAAAAPQHAPQVRMSPRSPARGTTATGGGGAPHHGGGGGGGFFEHGVGHVAPGPIGPSVGGGGGGGSAGSGGGDAVDAVLQQCCLGGEHARATRQLLLAHNLCDLRAMARMSDADWGALGVKLGTRRKLVVALSNVG